MAGWVGRKGWRGVATKPICSAVPPSRGWLWQRCGEFARYDGLRNEELKATLMGPHVWEGDWAFQRNLYTQPCRLSGDGFGSEVVNWLATMVSDHSRSRPTGTKNSHETWLQKADPGCRNEARGEQTGQPADGWQGAPLCRCRWYPSIQWCRCKGNRRPQPSCRHSRRRRKAGYRNGDAKLATLGCHRKNPSVWA